MIDKVFLFVSYGLYFVFSYFLSKIIRDDIYIKKVNLNDLRKVIFLSIVLMFSLILSYGLRFDLFFIWFIYFVILGNLYYLDLRNIKLFKHNWGINYADLIMIIILFGYLIISLIVGYKYVLVLTSYLFYVLVISFYLSYFHEMVNKNTIPFINVLGILTNFVVMVLLIEISLKVFVEWDLLSILTQL